jgi:hypothetical protein
MVVLGNVNFALDKNMSFNIQLQIQLNDVSNITKMQWLNLLLTKVTGRSDQAEYSVHGNNQTMLPRKMRLMLSLVGWKELGLLDRKWGCIWNGKRE